MTEVDSLQSMIDNVEQTSKTIATTVDALAKSSKGLKGAAMELANKVILETKTQLSLELDYTKELIPLLGQEIEYKAIVQAGQMAVNTAQSLLSTAKDNVLTAETEFKKITKTINELKRKSQYGGSPPSKNQELQFENAKKVLQTAKDGLAKAEKALKLAQEYLQDQRDILTGIQKNIAKIKVAMGAALGAIKNSINPLSNSNGGEQTTIEQSASQSTEQPIQTQTGGSTVQLTEEEQQEAQEMGLERQEAKKQEMENLSPILSKMDAEWMIIENGLLVLQNLAVPLPQTSSLPAAVGAAAPNPAFNMAVSGCIGLLGVFVLSEINAAVIRWSALAKENNIEPSADKLTKIASINAFKVSLPATCGTGATYVTPVIAQI